MKPSLIYRVAAALLLLFAVAHTTGFGQADPQWHAEALLSAMQSAHFDVMGSSRSYWDFFLAAGYSIGVFYLFAAILAWQLGGLAAETLARLRGVAWAFALCFAAITVLSWRYLFIVPVVCSAVVSVCLASAAWLSRR